MSRAVTLSSIVDAIRGFNALIYSEIVGPKGKVVAFDPYPLNIEISRFDAELNGRSNIQFVEAGLSNRRNSVSTSVLEQCVALKT
jgi:FkbM family methyltransferase